MNQPTIWFRSSDSHKQATIGKKATVGFRALGFNPSCKYFQHQSRYRREFPKIGDPNDIVPQNRILVIRTHIILATKSDDRRSRVPGDSQKVRRFGCRVSEVT